MKGLSCSDINTGWKPVAHEDDRNAPMQENPIQDPGSMEAKGRDPENGFLAFQHVQEILCMLREIQNEIISLKQFLMSMGNLDTVPNAMKKRKLRKRRLL